jgi:hypothetical protein
MIKIIAYGSILFSDYPGLIYYPVGMADPDPINPFHLLVEVYFSVSSLQGTPHHPFSELIIHFHHPVFRCIVDKRNSSIWVGV